MKTLSWDKIQQGDEEAFRQLYEQYADLLLSVSYTHLALQQDQTDVHRQPVGRRNDDRRLFHRLRTSERVRVRQSYVHLSLIHI